MGVHLCTDLEETGGSTTLEWSVRNRLKGHSYLSVHLLVVLAKDVIALAQRLMNSSVSFSVR